MTRSFVLCADDYALSEGVSQTIVALASRGRLSAVSCMTCTPYWAQHAEWLKPLIGKVDIGLHVTLVDEVPLAAMPKTAPNGKLPSISALILRSHLGLIDLTEIKAEVTAQFTAFERVLGVAPSHVDGHLHAHILPGIRDIVLQRAAACNPRPWVRNVTEPWPSVRRRGIAIPKSIVLNVLGRALAKMPARTNDGFSGLYGLVGDENYPAMFEKFVDSDAQRLVVMCHPGSISPESVACAQSRANESAFFASDNFTEMLARKDLRLGRFDDL